MQVTNVQVEFLNGKKIHIVNSSPDQNNYSLIKYIGTVHTVLIDSLNTKTLQLPIDAYLKRKVKIKTFEVVTKSQGFFSPLSNNC